MSHWTTIKTEVRDLTALAMACAELGKRCEVAPKDSTVKARGFGGVTTEAAAVVHLDGPYDVALIAQPDGSYNVQADFWNGHVAAELGEDCCRLMSLYACHKLTLEGQAQGLSVERETAEDGTINLIFTGAGL